MDSLNVEFDFPKAVYLPGQSVTGAVVFHLKSPESFKGLSVECIGKGQVHWLETQTAGRETETVHYQNSENYFYQKLLLFGEDTKELLPNTYRYPFAFKLPESLPTSFEGVHGSIRYYVRASLNRRYMLDAVFKKGFTVNAVLDLNLNPQASIPSSNEETKTVCCWCCRSGPITASAWLPKAGFVPGETIPFSGRVDNASRSRLVSASVRLVEKTVFKAQGQTKEEDRIIVQITRNHQSNAIVDVWDNVPILVPPLAPSGLSNCSIINLSYVLEFVIDPGAFSFNFKVPLEVIIGTIPLRQSFNTFQQPMPSAPPMQQGIAQLPPPIGFVLEPYTAQYPNLPPASVASGMFSGNLREEGDTEHLNIGYDTLFVPNYISFSSSPKTPDI